MWALIIDACAWLVGAILRILPTAAGQVLVALGIGVVTYRGIDVSLGWLKDFALSNFHALPPQVLGLLALMKIGVCINMVASAMAIRLGINGLTSGTFKQWIKK